MPEDGAKGSNISIIKKRLPSGKCFLRCWGESERVMRCEAAAELPGGSSGRGCGRAVEVRVDLREAFSARSGRFLFASFWCMIKNIIVILQKRKDRKKTTEKDG